MMKPKEIPVYIGIRLFLFLYGMLMWVSGIFGPRKKTAPRGMRVLLTGQFYSSNWILAHLKPLCMSSCCKEIIVVANCEIPAKDKVRILRPPVWLNSLAGATLSRLIYFAFIAAKTRPDVVGGFHLLLNGLSAALIARVVGARSLYFCVGGPAEVLDGGILSENRLFEKLREPHASIEKILTKWVTAFDIVITMGSSAVRFFKDRDMRGDVQIISGGLDTTYFTPAFQPATFDLIFAGRLVPIKRVDLFLESVRLLKESHPDIAAVIVGDGPLALELQNLSAEMGLSGNVHFAGFQADMAPWFNQAKIFILTSISEGLSLAMMEAMACGLPAVVPETGDLGDLVADGVNGYLTGASDPRVIATRISSLLDEPERLKRFSRSARQAAEQLSIANAAEKWNRIFEAAAVSPGSPMKSDEAKACAE
jgi:L-malate glycosyltransferase